MRTVITLFILAAACCSQQYYIRPPYISHTSSNTSPGVDTFYMRWSPEWLEMSSIDGEIVLETRCYIDFVNDFIPTDMITTLNGHQFDASLFTSPTVIEATMIPAPQLMLPNGYGIYPMQSIELNTTRVYMRTQSSFGFTYDVGQFSYPISVTGMLCELHAVTRVEYSSYQEWWTPGYYYTHQDYILGG